MDDNRPMGRECQIIMGHQDIPHLVDRRGCLPTDPLLTGLGYAFNRAAQQIVEGFTVRLSQSPH